MSVAAAADDDDGNKRGKGGSCGGGAAGGKRGRGFGAAARSCVCLAEGAIAVVGDVVRGLVWQACELGEGLDGLATLAYAVARCEAWGWTRLDLR